MNSLLRLIFGFGIVMNLALAIKYVDPIPAFCCALCTVCIAELNSRAKQPNT